MLGKIKKKCPCPKSEENLTFKGFLDIIMCKYLFKKYFTPLNLVITNVTHKK